MDIVKIACMGFAGVLLALLLRQSGSPYAELVSMATCLLILFYSVTRLASVLELLDVLKGYLTISDGYFKILMKIIGITYVADFSSSICKDAGYSAIAGQIEIFGKISILAVSSPILMALLETISSFL